MLETEYIKNLKSNYERVHLPQKPDEQRYQYCILTRGGIRGLLPCSLRYINGQAYLYYDITSRQNVAQLYGKQTLRREWVKDFFWSYEHACQELGRFLLDEKNILVYPEQIFQDLGNHKFYFLYLPYNEESNGMVQLLEFILGHMDYEDERLVECIYSMYEQYEKSGDVYLQEKIFEDARKLEESEGTLPVCVNEGNTDDEEESEAWQEEELKVPTKKENFFRQDKKSFFKKFTGKKKRPEVQKNIYEDNILDAMEKCAVAEDSTYEEEEYNRTIYVEQPSEEEKVHKLYTPDGRVAAKLDREMLSIGKQKDEVDFVLNDDSVSRLHARIYIENGIVYLEDLNSTNGTFKNGLRLQPYEKRRLEEGDEIRLGKLLFVYR